MANRLHVPKFGDWTEDAPFTVVFEKASKSKKNLNEYPNSAQTHDAQNVGPRHERFSSREDIEFRPSPAHNHRNNIVRAETYNHQSSRNPSEINRRHSQGHASVQPKPIRNLRGRSSERVATIPPFPVSGSNAESYTMIFDKVKEDKNQSVRSYGETAQSTPTRPIDDQHHNSLPSSPKSCCFPPWNRRKTY